jgi:hypothetical protein
MIRMRIANALARGRIAGACNKFDPHAIVCAEVTQIMLAPCALDYNLWSQSLLHPNACGSPLSF